ANPFVTHKGPRPRPAEPKPSEADFWHCEMITSLNPLEPRYAQSQAILALSASLTTQSKGTSGKRIRSSWSECGTSCRKQVAVNTNDFPGPPSNVPGSILKPQNLEIFRRLLDTFSLGRGFFV